MSGKFSTVKEVSSFRKIAAAMWKHPRDPTIYGSLDIEASAALAFIEAFREEHGLKLTISHLVARAVALAIARHPEVNAKVRYWGKLEQRKTIDLVLQVSTDGGSDLSSARIDRADEKSLREIVELVKRQAEKIRANDDENYAKSRGMFRRMPWWLARPAIQVADILTNELHLDLPQYGMPSDPFGSAMVTNVGMFGIDTAFAPFTPIARCPMLILVPQIRERPWVVGADVLSRPILRLCATFDHRVIDGFHAGKLSREIHGLLSEPAQLA